MSSSTVTVRATLFVLFLFAIAGIASAQTAENRINEANGSNEVLGYVGSGSSGLGVMFGGGYALAVRPRWRVVAEAGYYNLNDYNISGLNASAMEFSGNLHYLIPVRNAKFTPYVLGGAGVFRTALSDDLGLGYSLNANTFGINVGGGARWQVGPHWGVRPEIRYFVRDGSFTRLSVGFYYQFGH